MRESVQGATQNIIPEIILFVNGLVLVMPTAEPTSSALSAFSKLIDIKQMVYACDGSLIRKMLIFKLYLRDISAAYTVMVKEFKVSMRLITLDIEKAH